MAIVTSCEKPEDFKPDLIPGAKLYSLSSERGAISINKKTGKQSLMFSIGLESSGYDYKKSVVIGNTAYSVYNDELITFDFETNTAKSLANLPNNRWSWNLGLINNKLHALVCSNGEMPNVSLVEIDEMTGEITPKADFGSMLGVIPNARDQISIGSWIYSVKTNAIIAVGHSSYQSGGKFFCQSYIISVDLSEETMSAGSPYPSYICPTIDLIDRRGEIYVFVNAQSYLKLFTVDLKYLALSSTVVATFYDVGTSGGVCYDSTEDVIYMCGEYLTSYSMSKNRIKYMDSYNSNDNAALVLVP